MDFGWYNIATDFEIGESTKTAYFKLQLSYKSSS